MALNSYLSYFFYFKVLVVQRIERKIADLVMQVRFLPRTHYQINCRHLYGGSFIFLIFFHGSTKEITAAVQPAYHIYRQ